VVKETPRVAAVKAQEGKVEENTVVAKAESMMAKEKGIVSCAGSQAIAQRSADNDNSKAVYEALKTKLARARVRAVGQRHHRRHSSSKERRRHHPVATATLARWTGFSSPRLS